MFGRACNLTVIRSEQVMGVKQQMGEFRLHTHTHTQTSKLRQYNENLF